MATITTNNHERALVACQDVPETERDENYPNSDYVKAYGRFWCLDSAERFTDHALSARGYDGSILDHMNAGSCGLVLRYFDRNGYELDGVIVGWYAKPSAACSP